MTLGRAVEILNERKHHGHARWRIFRDYRTAGEFFVEGEDYRQRMPPGRAIASAERYEAGRTGLGSTCDICGGSGSTEELHEECPTCEGSGYAPSEQGREYLDFLRYALPRLTSIRQRSTFTDAETA